MYNIFIRKGNPMEGYNLKYGGKVNGYYFKIQGHYVG